MYGYQWYTTNICKLGFLVAELIKFLRRKVHNSRFCLLSLLIYYSGGKVFWVRHLLGFLFRGFWNKPLHRMNNVAFSKEGDKLALKSKKINFIDEKRRSTDTCVIGTPFAVQCKIYSLGSSSFMPSLHSSKFFLLLIREVFNLNWINICFNLVSSNSWLSWLGSLLELASLREYVSSSSSESSSSIT